jgi:hypothetical protein
MPLHMWQGTTSINGETYAHFLESRGKATSLHRNIKDAEKNQTKANVLVIEQCYTV